jgi:hypothetical protein
MFEKAETTREKHQKSKRRIKLPGMVARELRAKSKLGAREARLDAAEKVKRG